MSDDRILEWAMSLEAAEIAVFARARRRFLNRPSTKRLHALRTSTRRLRSLYDDFRDILKSRKRKRLDRLIELTGEARDAAVLRKLLTSTIDAREAAPARSLLQRLRKRERDGRKRVFRQLFRMHVK